MTKWRIFKTKEDSELKRLHQPKKHTNANEAQRSQLMSVFFEQCKHVSHIVTSIISEGGSNSNRYFFYKESNISDSRVPPLISSQEYEVQICPKTIPQKTRSK